MTLVNGHGSLDADDRKADTRAAEDGPGSATDTYGHHLVGLRTVEARAGDLLVATAEDDHRGRSLTLYTVQITRGEQLVARVTAQTAAIGSVRPPST